MRLLGVTHLAAVIPLHSHFDHAMDSPVVARLTVNDGVLAALPYLIDDFAAR